MVVNLSVVKSHVVYRSLIDKFVFKASCISRLESVQCFIILDKRMELHTIRCIDFNLFTPWIGKATRSF